MDIVLGVSMTPTTVRMVLVEGEAADGLTVDHDVFDVTAIDDAANSSAPDQVISAILGTQQSALVGGHRLVATGVTWSDHDEAAALRDGLAIHGIDDVTLVSDLHAAGALAQAAGRAVGYDKTALMFVERDTATLSVVETRDGSIVKVLSRSLHSADALAVMAEMVTSLEAHHARPQGVFVVGSGVDVASVKEHLEPLVSVPVSAPEDAAMALARGAALAAASAPRFEATTVGLAYSQDPDASSLAVTQMRPVSAPVSLVDDHDAEVVDEDRRSFLLVGSTLTTVFVIGVVALVISLAVSIRPTVDQRPNPGESIVVPSTPAPVAAPPPAVEQVQPPPSAAPPAPETIPAPVPVVQEAPATQPRQVFVEQAPAAAPAPAPAAPAPEPPAQQAPPAPIVTPPAYTPGYYPNNPYTPRNSWWWWLPDKPPWIDDDEPEQVPTTQPQQPPWNPPSQVPSPPTRQPSVVPRQPSIVQPQQPAVTPAPWVPPVPVIQVPVVQQPVLPQWPVIQDPVPQTPRQPVIQQPRQPSSPSTRGPRNNIPFWPFGDGD